MENEKKRETVVGLEPKNFWLGLLTLTTEPLSVEKSEKYYKYDKLLWTRNADTMVLTIHENCNVGRMKGRT